MELALVTWVPGVGSWGAARASGHHSNPNPNPNPNRGAARASGHHQPYLFAHGCNRHCDPIPIANSKTCNAHPAPNPVPMPQALPPALARP